MCELFASRELFFLPCFGCSKQGFVVSRRTLMEAAELVCFVGMHRSCRRATRNAQLFFLCTRKANVSAVLQVGVRRPP